MVSTPAASVRPEPRNVPTANVSVHNGLRSAWHDTLISTTDCLRSLNYDWTKYI